MAREIGIDLGHTNARTAWLSGPEGPQILPNSDAERFTPTMLAVHSDGQILTGRSAAVWAALHPERGVPDLMARLAAGEPIPLNGSACDPRVLTAHFLRRLKADAEKRLSEPVTRAWVTVPPAWDDAVRERLCAAGEQAQLAVSPVDSPIAAALAAGFREPAGRLQHILVYDLGGRTFSASVLAWEGGTLAVRRAVTLAGVGGASFDQQIVDYVTVLVQQQHHVNPAPNLRFMAELRKQAEQAKISLGVQRASDIVIMGGLRSPAGASVDVEVDLGREEFERMIEDKLAATITATREVIGRAGLSAGQIDFVVLAGGSTFIPCVRAAVEAEFGPQKIVQRADPLEGVALGAAWLTGEVAVRIKAAEAAGAVAEPAPVKPEAPVAPEPVPERATEDEIPTTPPERPGEAAPVEAEVAPPEEPPQPEPIPEAEFPQPEPVAEPPPEELPQPVPVAEAAPEELPQPVPVAEAAPEEAPVAEEVVPPAAPEEPKEFCGPYELVELVESGRYYEVFLGREPGSGARALVTLFRATDERAKNAFLSCLLPLGLEHPNVVRLCGFGHTPKGCYVATEFIGTRTLRDLMGTGPERQPAPIDRVLPLIIQVSEGLEALHQHHIFHRNLKPSNILVDADGQLAKIADFQIAVSLRGRDQVTQVAGTLPYMAKEVLEGRADHRADIYSVGVMLYELLTGKLPFWATSQRVLVDQITNQQPIEPRSLNPRIPEHVNDTILRALEKDPSRRFQTAAELRDALAREPESWFRTITSGGPGR